MSHIEGNILDVVFTSSDMYSTFEVVTQLPFNLRSDHYLITFTICPNTSRSISRSSSRGFTYDYSKADWDSILEIINNYNFDPFLYFFDIELLWTELKQVLYNQ